ncbi:MAG: hypothetical protein ABSG79_26060 [Bryobacteraceae bacterium]|jgi:hypothetical protein
MAATKPGVYATIDELVAAVAKKTKLEPAQVKAVLSESFPSTRAWIVSEIQKQPLSIIDTNKLISKINV